MLPIVFERLVQTIDDVLVAHLDGEFTAAVEAAGCQVDRADDGRGPVAKQRLPVQFLVLQLRTLMPTSSRMRRPPTPSTTLSCLSVCGARAITSTLTPRLLARTSRSITTAS